MDNFNNFFDDQRHNDENDDRNNTPIYHTPDPKDGKSAAAKIAPIVCIVMAIIMCLVVIINVIVIASLKNTIAQEYAQDLKAQAQSEYSEAIQNVLSDSDIVSDVTSEAANLAASRLTDNVGDIANTMAVSVARIYMYKNATSTPSTAEASGLASAFLITDTNATGTTERYLITNAHCVRYEKAVTSSRGGFGGWYQEVTYEWATYGTIIAMFENDSNIYNVEVIAYGAYEGDYLKAENKQADLALLKIVGDQPSNESHPSFKIAKTDFTTRGTEVALIGNPQGLGDTTSVAQGVVSQTGITISSWGTGTFLMTDAAVNGGNSGGPMINANGTVVGIVESKLVSTSIENMGFALSAGTLNDFISWASNATNNTTNSNITINYSQSLI